MNAATADLMTAGSNYFKSPYLPAAAWQVSFYGYLFLNPIPDKGFRLLFFAISVGSLSLALQPLKKPKNKIV
jgi:hypothetical protein